MSREQVEAEMAQNIARLIFSGYFKIFADKPVFGYKISNKPKISDFAMFQVNNCPQNGKYWFTSQTNAILAFEEYQVHVIKLLDGKHTVDDIKKDVLNKLTKGLIQANRDDKKIEDEKELQEIADSLTTQALNYLKLNYGLMS